MVINVISAVLSQSMSGVGTNESMLLAPEHRSLISGVLKNTSKNITQSKADAHIATLHGRQINPTIGNLQNIKHRVRKSVLMDYTLSLNHSQHYKWKL
jgi:NH3-dependent NAD+ synthetase